MVSLLWYFLQQTLFTAIEYKAGELSCAAMRCSCWFVLFLIWYARINQCLHVPCQARKITCLPPLQYLYFLSFSIANSDSLHQSFCLDIMKYKLFMRTYVYPWYMFRFMYVCVCVCIHHRLTQFSSNDEGSGPFGVPISLSFFHGYSEMNLRNYGLFLYLWYLS